MVDLYANADDICFCGHRNGDHYRHLINGWPMHQCGACGSDMNGRQIPVSHLPDEAIGEILRWKQQNEPGPVVVTAVSLVKEKTDE